MYRRAFFVVILLVIYGCGDSSPTVSSTPDTTSSETAVPQDAQAFSDTIQVPKPKAKPPAESNFCQQHFKRLDSLKRIAHSLLAERVYEPALRKEDVPQENIAFLEALSEQLRDSTYKPGTVLTIDQLLMSVFNLEANELGIVGTPKYIIDTSGIGTALSAINPEYELLSKIEGIQGVDFEDYDTLLYFPKVSQAAMQGQSSTRYIYTDKRRTTASIKNLAFPYSECLEYYLYPISTSDIVVDERVLFATSLPIQLDYGRYVEIEKLLKNRTLKYRRCFDCNPDNYEPQTAFAKLKGVDHLYFTYTDTFPVNNEYDYPSRALVMQLADSSMMYLWREDVDLFGCSCL